MTTAPGGAGRCADRAAAARAIAAVRSSSGSSSGPRRSPTSTSCPAPADVWHAFAQRWSTTAERLVDPLDLPQPRRSSDSSPPWSIGPRWAAGREGPAGTRGDRAAADRPAVAAVGRLGARRDHLVRPDRRHDLLRRARRVVPSIANGLVAGIDQIPPLYRGSARSSVRAAWPAGTSCCPRRCPATCRAQAGLGVLLAFADGRGDHRRLPELGFGLAYLKQGATSTTCPGDRRDLPDPGRRHRRSNCWCSAPLERRVLRVRGLAGT